MTEAEAARIIADEEAAPRHDGRTAAAPSAKWWMRRLPATSAAGSMPNSPMPNSMRWPAASTIWSRPSIAAWAKPASVLAALADTDLTQRMEGDYQGAFAQLKDDTNAVADKLADIVVAVARHLAARSRPRPAKSCRAPTICPNAPQAGRDHRGNLGGHGAAGRHRAGKCQARRRMPATRPRHGHPVRRRGRRR